MKIIRIVLYIVVLSFLICCTVEQQKQRYAFISPLANREDMSAFIDAEFPAVFSVRDFDVSGGTLSFTVYSENLYSAAILTNMQPGDTLLYNQDTLIVKQVILEGETIRVNGDIDEGGACFQLCDDATYRAVQYDDYSIYSEVGQITLPLDPYFILIDCGENPADPSLIIKKNYMNYLQGLPEYRQSFSYLDTRVKVSNGMITHVLRKWIP